MPQPSPFTVRIPDADIEDLRRRLRATNWPSATARNWEAGVDAAWHRDLVEHWAERFDWREQERRLNELPHFRAEIDGRDLHYLHYRSQRPDSMPILLLHGWPGSFVQMLDLASHLSAPAPDAEPSQPAFDVVVGSLPGFGFSDEPPRGEANERNMAKLFHRLMTGLLGYRRYAIRGSDFGAGVLVHMADLFPDSIIAVHQGGTAPRAEHRPSDATDAERRFFADCDRWQKHETGYGRIQRTKPETLAVALNDSPAGLAGWIAEKYRAWSDCGGDVERRFSKDQLLLNISIYWFTRTIGSSVRLYRESVGEPQTTHSTVPAAFLMPIHDMFPTPREWVARTSRIDRWNAPDRGGHFMEWEEPGLVAADIREFLGERANGTV